MHLHLAVKSGSHIPFAAQRFFLEGGGTWCIFRYVKRITGNLNTYNILLPQPNKSLALNVYCLFAKQFRNFRLPTVKQKHFSFTT